nr:MAG TPA: hypothetical protein [Caudoviricetes sp.]
MSSKTGVFYRFAILKNMLIRSTFLVSSFSIVY